MVGLRHVLADDKLALNGDRDQDLLAIALRALIDLDFDVTVPGVSLAEEAGLTDPPRNAPIGGYVPQAAHQLSGRGAGKPARWSEDLFVGRRR